MVNHVQVQRNREECFLNLGGGLLSLKGPLEETVPGTAVTFRKPSYSGLPSAELLLLGEEDCSYPCWVVM